jgi:hypothetical protein
MKKRLLFLCVLSLCLAVGATAVGGSGGSTANAAGVNPAGDPYFGGSDLSAKPTTTCTLCPGNCSIGLCKTGCSCRFCGTQGFNCWH